jgi:hypothetical protein
MASQCGVQQGDPCGPAAFSWGIQGIIEGLDSLVEWQLWYLDDGLLIGSRDQLQKALVYVANRAREAGIELNVDKCVLWGPAVALGTTGQPALEQVPKRQFVRGSGITVLGIPICMPGDEAWAVRVMDDRRMKVEKTCAVLKLLSSSQVQYTLLRQCLDVCRINDLIRALPATVAQEAVGRYSQTLRRTLGWIIGHDLSDQEWAQSTLPIRAGGLGIGDPLVQRLPARMATLVEFATHGGDTVGVQDDLGRGQADAPYVIHALLCLLGEVTPLKSWKEDVGRISEAQEPHNRQKWWLDKVHVKLQERLAESLTGQQSTRFACQRTGHSGAWLAATPSKALGTLIPTVEFRCLLKWHLGISQVSEDLANTPCPRCQVPMDVKGHHLVCCKNNNRVRRHMAIQDTVVTLARQAGLACRKEARADDNSRPGDILFLNWEGRGPAAVDVTVRDPLALSHPVQTDEGVQAWRERQEKEKRQKYTAQCNRLQWVFVPFVMDVFGGLAQEATELVNKLVRGVCSQSEKWLHREVEARVWQRLTLNLMREVGRQLVWATMACDADEGTPLGFHTCDY